MLYDGKSEANYATLVGSLKEGGVSFIIGAGLSAGYFDSRRLRGGTAGRNADYRQTLQRGDSFQDRPLLPAKFRLALENGSIVKR